VDINGLTCYPRHLCYYCPFLFYVVFSRLWPNPHFQLNFFFFFFFLVFIGKKLTGSIVTISFHHNWLNRLLKWKKTDKMHITDWYRRCRDHWSCKSQMVRRLITFFCVLMNEDDRMDEHRRRQVDCIFGIEKIPKRNRPYLLSVFSSLWSGIIAGLNCFSFWDVCFIFGFYLLESPNNVDES